MREWVACSLWSVVWDLWFVAHLFIYYLFILWFVLSNPDPPIESAQLGVCALGEPSYTVELSHLIPAVPLSQVVGHPSIHPSNLSC